MIIKYITTLGIEFIFENATNVTIDRRTKYLNESNDDEPNVFENLILDDINRIPRSTVKYLDSIEPAPAAYKLVIFIDKDGISKGLYVFNEAYICNDEGKTISKVIN